MGHFFAGSPSTRQQNIATSFTLNVIVVIRVITLTLEASSDAKSSFCGAEPPVGAENRPFFGDSTSDESPFWMGRGDFLRSVATGSAGSESPFGEESRPLCEAISNESSF